MRQSTHPTRFPSRNNRLARYHVFGPDPDGEGGQPRPMLRTVKYVYQITGNVSDIMVKDHYVSANPTLTPGPQENYQWVWHLGLYYNVQGELFRAIWDRWKEPYDQYYHQPKFLRAQVQAEQVQNVDAPRECQLGG